MSQNKFRNNWLVCGIALFLIVPPVAMAKDEASAPGKVKYKTGKDIDFEELLIQGELKRPEITVVTGDNKKGGDGLLRLRENFLDRVTTDVGEEIP